MTNAVIIVDEQVYFPTLLKKPNNLLAKTPLDSYYCRFGFILPTEYTSLNLIDVLEGNSSYAFVCEVTVLGCILTHEGILYEYIVGLPVETSGEYLKRRRIGIGKNTRYVRADSSRIEEQVCMLLHLVDEGHIPSMDEAFKILNKVSPNQSPMMECMDISAILSELKARKFTDPLPGFQKLVN